MEKDAIDYHQEIVRSAYADMLHDTERNQKYEAAIRKAVDAVMSGGEEAIVLDIGTGTGLLSMMSVRAGAKRVYACDAFKPAVKCAAQIIKTNHMEDKVSLISKLSTDVKIGVDMHCQANILVTEVFDTELIGEGAIETFRHALEHLLQKNCIVVPAAANLYVQPVESEFLWERNSLFFTLPDEMNSIKIPANVSSYHNSFGSPLYDCQLSALANEKFTRISPPLRAFRFDFAGREELLYENSSKSKVQSLVSGKCHAFFMWWDLEMDMQGEIILSCAPYWEHSEKRECMQWRDHWMQAIYYPSTIQTLSKGSEFTITARHDEFSLSFDIEPENQLGLNVSGVHMSILHCAFTRSALGLLHDKERICKFYQMLKPLVNEHTIALSVSDATSLPFLLARLGADKVYAVSQNKKTCEVLNLVIERNDDITCVTVVQSVHILTADILSQVTLVVGEPQFYTSSLPWHDLSFKHSLSSVSVNCSVIPKSACIKAVVMEFDNLHLIRAPVVECQGFDLSLYDQMIEKSRSIADNQFERQPLWEYSGRALSNAYTILQYDFHCKTSERIINCTHAIPVISSGSYNGLALWMEYELADGVWISQGPIQGKITPGLPPHWRMDYQQAVHLPVSGVKVTALRSRVNCSLDFYTDSCEIVGSISAGS